MRKRIAGASQRKAVSRLNDVELPCQDGLVCVSSADGVQTCQEQNNQGLFKQLYTITYDL